MQALRRISALLTLHINILSACTVFLALFDGRVAMNDYTAIGPTTVWLALLSDKDALLKHPGLHHKRLVGEANALHRANLIGRDYLSDLLEQADGALAYAVEALLDDCADK